MFLFTIQRQVPSKHHSKVLSHRTVHVVDHSMAVRCLAFTKDRLFSGSDDMTILCYDITSSHPSVLKSYCNHSGWVTGITVSADEEFMASWYDF